MPEITLPCGRCGRQCRGRDLRTVVAMGVRVHVCRSCHVKLVEETLADRKREPKLSEEVQYSQAELPF